MPKKSKKKKSSSSNNHKNNQSEADNTELKRKQLLQNAHTLKTQIENENKTKEDYERKLKQVQFYWDLEKEELKKKELELSQRESKEEELLDNHQREIEDIKEGIKELLYQQQNDLIREKNERRVELYKVQEEHSIEQRKNQTTSTECQHYLRNMQESHINFLNQLQHNYEKHVRRLQDEFRGQFKDITTDFERKIKVIGEEFDAKLKKDLTELEERKDEKVKHVQSEQDEELTDLRNRCNGKIHDQLDQIKVLKNQLHRRKLQLRQTEKKLNETRIQNKNIVEPLTKAKEELDNLQIECKEFKDQKRLYNRRKDDLKAAEAKLKDVQWRHEVLFQKYELLVSERDKLKEEMRKGMMREKQRKNLEAVIHQKQKDELYSLLKKYHDALSDEEIQNSVVENNTMQQKCNKTDETGVDHISKNSSSIDDSRRHILKKIEEAIESLEIGKQERIKNYPRE